MVFCRFVTACEVQGRPHSFRNTSPWGSAPPAWSRAWVQHAEPFQHAVDQRNVAGFGPRLVLACVNVGANYGYYTLLMAAACGRGGQVRKPAGLEAATSRRLRTRGPDACRRTEPYVGGNRNIHAERWAYPHRSGSIQVPAITQDRALAGWERLDLVKIDAEGAEAMVW